MNSGGCAGRVLRQREQQREDPPGGGVLGKLGSRSGSMGRGGDGLGSGVNTHSRSSEQTFCDFTHTESREKPGGDRGGLGSAGGFFRWAIAVGLCADGNGLAGRGSMTEGSGVGAGPRWGSVLDGRAAPRPPAACIFLFLLPDNFYSTKSFAPLKKEYCCHPLSSRAAESQPQNAE